MDQNAERQIATIYACATIFNVDPKINSIYNSAIDEILNKGRTTQFSYVDGMSLFNADITDEEKRSVLEVTQSFFQKRCLEYISCYLDMLGRNNVNYGLYLSSSNQLDSIKRSLSDSFKITFIADSLGDWHYRERSGTRFTMVGHKLSEPHIQNG